MNKPCKIWTGYIEAKGYGVVYVHGKRQKAHRVAYERVNGPIPIGYHIHHECGNKACVELEHLKLLKEEVHNGKYRSDRTHCPYGHEFTPENTAWLKTKKGASYRRCKACRNLLERAAYDIRHAKDQVS